jgi:1,4-alpha-glucan branching enzyme
MLGTILRANGVAFRVLAPHAKQVSVVGTFSDDDPFRSGKFMTITARLEHLKRLGVNAIQIMPVGQLNGWSEVGKGGIYFYNDDRACTPWGETRPDYRRGEVRQFILDNVLMLLVEYRVDDLRFDSTQYVRKLGEGEPQELPDGWSIPQAINETVSHSRLGRITIAEDSQSNHWITKDVGAGGAGFVSQWDPHVVRPSRLLNSEFHDDFVVIAIFSRTSK